MIALAFSLVGSIILARYGSHPAESHPWIFWFAAFWTLALALLIAIALSSFRSSQRERRGERQLQQVARLHRSILDSAGPMMIACDLTGRINLFNPAAERMLGYRTHEALGTLTAPELFSESEMARVGEQLAASMPTFRAHPEVPPNTAPALLSYGLPFRRAFLRRNR
jgi:PAS domain-containing protein